MRQDDDTLLQEGLELPLIEDFYTIQGEGFHAGKAAYFLRLGGCDIGCKWCDTKFSWNSGVIPPTPVADIVARVQTTIADTVVVTGGEPLLYNLDALTGLLRENDIDTFIETSGAHPLSGCWDWICLSPKQDAPPLDVFFSKADELKVIVTETDDFRWAEENANRVREGCSLFLQPEWSRYESLIPLVVDYVKAHPRWELSLQIHKFMHIP